MLGLGSASDTDAIELLKQDHDEAEKLFDQYEDAKDEDNVELKVQIATAVCRALAVHAMVEEELFYPALREADDMAAELLDEALVEHASVKQLVAVIEAGAPDDPLYDATVRVLGEYVKHHVKEEEGEIFPVARKAGLDLEALGAAIRARKAELEAAPSPTPSRNARRNGEAKASGRGSAKDGAGRSAKGGVRKPAARH